MYEFTLYRLAGMVPLFLVWSAGALLCLMFVQRAPRAVVFVGAAMGVQFLAIIFFSFLPMLSAAFLFSTDIGTRVFLMSLMTSIPSAISWGLILWAVFGDRLAQRAGKRALHEQQNND